MSRRTGIQRKAAESNARQTTRTLGTLVRRMNEEVRLSENATRILTCSSSVLQGASSRFDSIGHTILGGGKLLSKYARREITDKILLASALSLYFGVILYILQKRVFTFYLPW
jgi:protein transport protein SEC20